MNNTVVATDLGVPVRAPYTKTATGVSGGDVVAPASNAAPIVDSATVPQSGEVTTPTHEAETPKTLLEQFHPSLDPSKVQMTFDDKTGRVRVVPIAEIEAQASTAADDGANDIGLPDLSTPSQYIPGGSEAQYQNQQGQGGNEARLQGEISELKQLVTAMAQAQIAGRPLGEVLGLQQPAQPAQPDFSQVDLYDPAQLAGFIQQTVQGAMQGAIQPHQETLANARLRQEYDSVALQNAADPHFNTKIVQALTLVKENPALSIPQAYGLVNRIASNFIQPANQAQPAQQAKPATRTITAEQAAQKAAQAKSLPGNSGVKGAGNPPMPSHIKGLGQMIAWNLQQTHESGQ